MPLLITLCIYLTIFILYKEFQQIENNNPPIQPHQQHENENQPMDDNDYPNGNYIL